MKTKDLIAALQEEDPSGELECCVGNVDIHFLSTEPAYYDGPLQVLKRDPTTEYYNIIGAEYRRGGMKVQIHTLSIDGAIFNDETTPVTYDCDNTKLYCGDRVDRYRADAIKIKNSVELEHFVRYIKEKYQEHKELYDLEKVAKWYYDINWDYKKPLPEDLIDIGMSINERREVQWDREITWEKLMEEYDDV